MAGRLQAMGQSAMDYARSLVLPRPESGGVLNLTDEHSPSAGAAASQPLLQPSSSLSVAASDIAEPPPVGGSDVLWHPQMEHPDWQGDVLPKNWFSWRSLWAFTGPGALMSIAYIDPGNLESDLQAGAQTGYTILWVLMWSTIMGYFMQMLSAKLGVATGEHLAELCRREYPFWTRYTLWIMAEIAIIGSDIQEVIGSAIAIQLLSLGYIPLWGGVVITAVDAFFFLLLDRLGVRRLEAFFAFLITIMAVTFGYMFVDAQPPLGTILESLAVPKLPSKDVNVAVGIVGAVIMPHNLYLHSALVQSRDLTGKPNSRKKEALRYFSIESAGALVVSLFINVFIMAVFAKGFFGKDIPDIGLANAGRYLGDTFGTPVMYIWALGLLAAGQSSTMTGTYTGQFVMQGYLDLKVSPMLRIVITRSVALLPTLLVVFVTSTPNKLDVLNQWLNILQSVQLVFAVLPLLVLTSSERVMGKVFVNSIQTNVLASLMAALVVGINCYLVYVSVYWGVDGHAQSHPLVMIGVGAVVLAYLAFTSWLVILPFTEAHRRKHEAAGRSVADAADDKVPVLQSE